jgi:hypothetical protein
MPTVQSGSCCNTAQQLRHGVEGAIGDGTRTADLGGGQHVDFYQGGDCVDGESEFATDSGLEETDLPPIIKQKGGEITPRDASVAQGGTVLALSIGIGGHLAVPPLPHHPAYGSVPRRFGGSSARPVFHEEQSRTTEASFGEGGCRSFVKA